MDKNCVYIRDINITKQEKPKGFNLFIEKLEVFQIGFGHLLLQKEYNE